MTIKINSDHRHAAIILILTELYIEDYTGPLASLGGWFFDDYTNYDGLEENQKEKLFELATKQLKDLNLIDYSSMCNHTGEIRKPRLTGQGELILANLFGDESLDKFLKKDQKEKNTAKEIINQKIKEEGIEVFVKIVAEGLKSGYTGLISILQS